MDFVFSRQNYIGYRPFFRDAKTAGNLWILCFPVRITQVTGHFCVLQKRPVTYVILTGKHKIHRLPATFATPQPLELHTIREFWPRRRPCPLEYIQTRRRTSIGYRPFLHFVCILTGKPPILSLFRRLARQNSLQLRRQQPLFQRIFDIFVFILTGKGCLWARALLKNMVF